MKAYYTCAGRIGNPYTGPTYMRVVAAANKKEALLKMRKKAKRAKWTYAIESTHTASEVALANPDEVFFCLRLSFDPGDYLPMGAIMKRHKEGSDGFEDALQQLRAQACGGAA